MPPAGGKVQPSGHRVAVEHHHCPDVPVSASSQRASPHAGGRPGSSAEHHGRERTGKMGREGFYNAVLLWPIDVRLSLWPGS